MRLQPTIPMNLPLAALMAAILMPLTEALAVPVFEPVQAFEIAPRDPQGKLVQGADGSFYGTTSDGGASGQGTIYKLSADGTLTTVFHFAGANGSTPKAGLILASDGSFYGTTSKGGGGYGTVFKMTTAGQVATVGTFGGADGSDAQAALVEGPDGNFYGTTSGGGSLAKGTVFRITPEGTLTTLVSFTGPNGSEPQAELVIGNDGNFYGTTFEGGSESSSGVSGYGTVFRITPGGALTTLVTFVHSNGGGPTGPLVRGLNGDFYGTTSFGGGIYFRALALFSGFRRKAASPR